MLDLNSTDLSKLLDLGVASQQAGRIAEAETLYRAVLLRNEDEPEALNLLGVILQDRGDLQASIEMLGQAIRHAPDFSEAHANLSRAQRAAGAAAEAAASAKCAVALAPDLAEAHLALGRALLDLKENPAAARACREAARLDPSLPDALAMLGVALNRLGDFAGAASVLRAAARARPEDTLVLIALGKALIEIGEFDEALIHHRRAVELTPGDVHAWFGLAVAMARATDTAGAIHACREALALAPKRADLWTILGSQTAALGQFDEAAACHRRALEIDPRCTESQRELVAIRQHKTDPAERAVLHTALDEKKRWTRDRVAAGFALGSEYERIGEFDAAFECFRKANWLALGESRARGNGFDRKVTSERVDWALRTFGRSTFQATRGWGCSSELPVFVVGMPRSGTTLVEQIASSHPHVFGAGELRDIPAILDTLAARRASDGPTHWLPARVRQEAEAHIARLAALDAAAVHVIDKLPDNIQCLGQIAILFPRARIILCRRDLRDVGLSCHTQRFTDGMAWTCDLADLAFRMREIERLVRHWKAVVPLQILEIQYETLVSDLEGQSRRLIDFLGLPWAPSCLEFQKNDRAVLTASRWQVRQPIYTTSIGRWRNYRKHLGPLLEGLKGLVPEDDTPPPD